MNIELPKTVKFDSIYAFPNPGEIFKMMKLRKYNFQRTQHRNPDYIVGEAEAPTHQEKPIHSITST